MHFNFSTVLLPRCDLAAIQPLQAQSSGPITRSFYRIVTRHPLRHVLDWFCIINYVSIAATKKHTFFYFAHREGFIYACCCAGDATVKFM